MDFKGNDLVFGKVKGYPYWHARIFKMYNETYKTVVRFELLFFATNKRAMITKIDLRHYSQNKSKNLLLSSIETCTI